MDNKSSFVATQLVNAAGIFDERNKIYGSNYLNFGKVMLGMFPNGLHATTESEMNRLGILIQMMSKLTRYSQNFNKGGHRDSLDDLCVYAMMCAESDEVVK